MKRIYSSIILLAVLICTAGCGGYTKLSLGKVTDIQIGAISLLYADVTVSAEVNNGSGKDLLISGADLSCEELKDITVSMSSPLVIPKGHNIVEVPLKIGYSPFSFLALTDKVRNHADEEYTVKAVLKLPRGKNGKTIDIPLRKKMTGSDLVSLVKKLRK